MKFALFLLLICLLTPTLSYTSAEAQSSCEHLRAEIGTRRNFSPPLKIRLLAVRRVRGRITGGASKQVAEVGGNYFVPDQNLTSVTVFKGGGHLLKINVPEYSYRPLKARWTNPKLLYLETWFNPHYGAYWIYDIEREKVITHELMNDGYAAWVKCLQSNEQK
jgi:hypothetical protein